MQIINIQKKSGGTRKIYAPNKEEKVMYREILLSIPQPEAKLKSAHGFLRGKSPVTNAQAHVSNYKPTGLMISMDLSNFFGRVVPQQVVPHLPEKMKEVIIGHCFPDGAAQQGLPTSPALANLAAIGIDEAIRKLIKKQWITAVYTRYADDLSISFPDTPEEPTETIIAKINEIVSRCGHSINAEKTKIQLAKAGRWECCGVMVGNEGVVISRKQRRKLRILNYMAERSDNCTLMKRAIGLAEWSKLKKPVTEEERRAKENAEFHAVATTRNEEALQIAQAFELGTTKSLMKEETIIKATVPDIHLAENVIITKDPVMIYGMSALGSNWSSCMDINKNHSSALGVEAWRQLEGVSIAYVKSKKKKNIAGITRNTMKERALVFELVDGRKAFGIVYPRKGYEGYVLGKTLREAGYIEAHKCRGFIVKGELSTNVHTAYADIGQFEIFEKKDGRIAVRYVL